VVPGAANLVSNTLCTTALRFARTHRHVTSNVCEGTELYFDAPSLLFQSF
jgi:hypothetical protein